MPSQEGAGAPPRAAGQEAVVADCLDAIKLTMTSWGEEGFPRLDSSGPRYQKWERDGAVWG